MKKKTSTHAHTRTHAHARAHTHTRNYTPRVVTCDLYTVFIDVFVQGKGIWIRYNGRTVGPRYGTRKEQSVSFSGMESAVATLRGTKRKAESNRVQSLRESKVILLPE